MITILTFHITRYFNIPFENFTDKLISALGIANLIDEFDKKDKEKLYFIEQNTHKNLMVSFYKLDRVVNPAKGEIKDTEYSFKFKRNEFTSESDKYITISDGGIQKYLCEAIREVHEILMRNLKDYTIEQKMTMPKSSGKELSNLLELIS